MQLAVILLVKKFSLTDPSIHYNDHKGLQLGPMLGHLKSSLHLPNLVL